MHDLATKSKKRALRCISLFPTPACLCIQHPVRADSSYPPCCRDALELQLISNSEVSCKGVNFGNNFLLKLLKVNTIPHV